MIKWNEWTFHIVSYTSICLRQREFGVILAIICYRCVMPLYIYRLDKHNLAIYGYTRRHFSRKG